MAPYSQAPVSIALDHSLHSTASTVRGVVRINAIDDLDYVRVEVAARTRRYDADEITHEHEIMRIAVEPWSSARSDDDDCPTKVPFAIELPVKAELPSSLRLMRAKDAKGRSNAAVIEYAVIASAVTTTDRYRASCAFTFAPISPGGPDLTLTPSRHGPPVLDSRWSIASDVIKISRGFASSASTELKIAVPNVKSFTAGSSVPFVLVISAKSAKHSAQAPPDLAVPLPCSGVKVILSQSHATPGQPTVSRDICDVFSLKSAQIFDTGVTFRGTTKGRHERTIVVVGKFCYAGACSFKGPLDRISYTLRLDARLPDSTRPHSVELPITLHSGLTMKDLKEHADDHKHASTYLGCEAIRKKSKGKEPADPLALARMTSNSSARSGYSDTLSVTL